MKIVLLDGDMLAYRNSAALEDSSTVDWGEGVVSNVDQAWKGHARMDRFISRLRETLEADSVVVCMSSQHSFRRNICPTYKEDRAAKPQPALRREFEQHLRTAHNAVTIDGLEADDVMGITATRPGKTEYVIVSIDKDLRQIPGWYYNPYPANKKPVAEMITTEAANDFFFYQTMVGDVIDGYKGCRGLGPKKASAVIALAKLGMGSEYPLAAVWQAVVKAYIAKGSTEESALMNARMARILRYEDYDQQKGVRLWLPPFLKS